MKAKTAAREADAITARVFPPIQLCTEANQTGGNAAASGSPFSIARTSVPEDAGQEEEHLDEQHDRDELQTPYRATRRRARPAAPRRDRASSAG